MRVQLCYRKEDTPNGKVKRMDFNRIKDAMNIWNTQISKIATCGYLRKFGDWHCIHIKH